ncbi:hypothetical protein BDD12DRAFT_896945 [Trichophaea hybrida]|nr:hypothetical protein BDD12DRAFT_896945 [Trichophaea hybrida]
MPRTLVSLPVEILSIVYSSLPDFSSALNLSLTSQFLHAVYQYDRRSIHLSILRQLPLLHSFFNQSLSLYLLQHPNTPSKIPFDSPQTITTILDSAAITNDLANYNFANYAPDDTSFTLNQIVWSIYVRRSDSCTVHAIRDAIYTLWGLSLNPTSDLSILFENDDDREEQKEQDPFANQNVHWLLARPFLSAVNIEEGPEDPAKKKNPFVNQNMVCLLARTPSLMFGFPGEGMKQLMERGETYAREIFSRENLRNYCN